MRNLIPDLKQLGYFDIHSDKKSGSVDASVMFVDISGFTNMTRKLMSRGSDGAETLSVFMNTIFNPLIEAVYNQNGFILNFAGDAFTAVFKGDNGSRAITAAFTIHRFFTENPSLYHRGEAFKISAKAGISIGKFNWIAAKGEENLRHFLFFGDVVDEAAEAEHHCQANDICINDKVFSILKADCVTHIKEGAYFVDELLAPAEVTPAATKPKIEELEIFIPRTVIEQEIPGEFREVVSLFISYKISKEMSEIEKMLEYLASYVQKYGGYISGFDFGDKGATLLALFGAPVSYEDNLERAIDCVAEIRKNCDTELRSGITQGVVYAGFVGSPKRAAYTALGDNVNLSARIMMKTPYGFDWIAGKAAEKAKSVFALESKGEFAFKGIDIPIEVFEIQGHLKVEEDASFSTVFTGRAEELKTLSETCSKCRENKKLYAATIYGEAGIGKSRLIYEIRKKSNDFRVFTLKTDTILRQSMNMFTNFFHTLFNQNENASSDENLAAFEKVWNAFSAEIANKKEAFEAAKPYIEALSGIIREGSVYKMLDAKNRYENTMYAVCDFFVAIAETRPLMLVMDDMLTVDSDSVAIIRALVKALDEYPVVIYILSRLNDDGTKPEILTSGGDRFREIVIDKMQKSEIPMLVKNILGEKGNKELNDFVFSRTDGNPFFIEQLVLFMKDKKYIQNTGKHYALTSNKTEVPSGVNSLLVSRLDRLSLHLKDLVFRASVMGNNIDLLVLNDIAQEQDKQNIPNLLKEGVDELVWNEASTLLYSFRHALLRDAAYSMQLKARLKEIHKKVANAIEKNYKDEEKFFSTLAFHYEKAEDTDKETFYLRKAAAYAKSQYHNQEAEKMYEKLLGVLKDDAERIKAGHSLANVYKIEGKWDLAEKMFKESLELSQKIGDELLIAISMKELANMMLQKGRYDEASPLLDNADELYKKLDDTKGKCDVEGFRGLIHYYKGELDDAVEHFTEKLRLAEIIGDKTAKALSYRYMGGVAYYRGDYQTALQHYKNQLKISKDNKNLLDVAVAENNIGLVYSYLNDFKNAAKFYRRALETYKKVGIRQYICYTSNNLGELKYWLGEYDEAKSLIEDQLSIATELGIRRHIALAHLILGNIAKKELDYNKSEEHYLQAIAIAKELNANNILCEFLFEYADLLFRTKRYDKAMELSKEAGKIIVEVNRKDLELKNLLFQWKIISLKDPEKAIEGIQNMITDDLTGEILAGTKVGLFDLTHEERYRKEAIEIIESLYATAPKKFYKETLDHLRAK
ncbi:tetratricopeptide repeat protein [bacterium]|nr:tetratricopeptide repeat protein [bacterium]